LADSLGYSPTAHSIIEHFEDEQNYGMIPQASNENARLPKLPINQNTRKQ